MNLGSNKKWIWFDGICKYCKTRVQYNIKTNLNNLRRFKCKSCNLFLTEGEIIKWKT